ncbi:dual specificity protein phosphatase, putative [Entamoeba invadens IP1]|uniref:protein-tyrosine-phosphatase n=1 Tax=Entamoeba invadens IP1 TaxID=370355 RepID=A0A0A1TX44_ENTIV|nr:dual specificity protein phosphatase, putative [Entamoeba invadens IP1]ELP83927.1 dual specificity protein phosphatase, putative [Entamoeba invadens IP1]|eukprot:XP_004183273.1 dual specificity protein phosphatase, putative [Entamoeba invadens IP1]
MQEKWKRGLNKRAYNVLSVPQALMPQMFEYINTIEPSLEYVDTTSEKITTLDGLAVFTNLTGLSAEFNNLKSLNALPTSLQMLSLHHNDLTSLDIISTLTNLTFLNVACNKLSSLNYPLSVKVLNCSDNPLQKLEGMSCVESLSISRTLVTELKIENAKLTALDCSQCTFSSLEIKCDNLTTLVANGVEFFVDKTTRKSVNFALQKVGTEHLCPQKLAFDFPLVLHTSQLVSLKMSLCRKEVIEKFLSQIHSLQHIELEFCNLYMCPDDLFKYKELRTIDLKNNPLSVIPIQLTTLTNMVTLNFSNCPIIDHPSFKPLVNLKSLGLSFESGRVKTGFEEKRPRNCKIEISLFGCCDKIIDGLFLGNYPNALNKTFLKECGITHILSVAPYQPMYPGVFTYKVVNVMDNTTENIAAVFDECFDFIEKGMEAGGVLVHCFAGVSRSATIVIAFLMKKNRWSLKKATNFVRNCRPIIAPNPAFQQQLEVFGKSIPSFSCILV